MSLTVTPRIVEAAMEDRLDDDAFVACVRDSLPYAYHLVAELVAALPGSLAAGRAFAGNATAPPDDEARGQLLRALASTSIRTALERHFGVALAFQNCHQVAVFAPEAVEGEAYRAFVSTRAQILNQRPELVHC
jgi:hypothetical protein